ncbi:MAG: Rieske (2Fe-2S) protein [bacterium]|nr:Rieske (2Fe-2S) protein [bacterium]
MEKRKIVIAKIGELPQGKMKRFKLGFRNALLAHTVEGYKAYYDFCTHQGGQLRMQSEQTFQCLRHFAEFDVLTGARISGEAPEGSRLTPIPIEYEGDEIIVYWEIND